VQGIGEYKKIPDFKFQISDCQFRIRNLESGIKFMKLYSSLAFIFLLCMAGYAWSQDVQVTASVGSDTVGVQDQFQFTITVTGKDSGDTENPRISRLQGFKIVSGPSVSSQSQWINGRSSSSRSFIYILIPEKEGQFTIDPVDVRVGGKVYKTQPLQVRVTSAARRPSAPPRRSFNPFDSFEEEDNQSRQPNGDAVFVKAELDRDSAYPGQQVTLTYKVFTQVGITGIQLQDSPALSGFWVEDLEVEKNPRGIRQAVNGREYQAFTVKKQALFATASGKLKIPSSIFAISASMAGDLFGILGRTETLYRKTQELSLDVKPLPAAGRPADFSNAIGSFKLNAVIDKTEVATGEAVALRVKLEGQGNLKMIPDISVPPFTDLTIYSSKRADTTRPFAEDQLGGEKTWEYVLVPKAPGRQTIPSFSFSYFSPERDKYETITTPVLSLNVVRGGDSATSVSALSGSGKQNLTRRGTDINYIKPLTGSLEGKDKSPLYQTLWFYLLLAGPFAFNLFAFLLQKHQSRLAENQGFVRSRMAKRKALEQLKIAEKEGKSDTRRFYDRTASALSGYLSDKFNLTEIQLTGDTLERALSEHSVPREAVEEIKTCLQECDFGRFVSASNSPGKMLELGTRIRKSIDVLEKAATSTDFHQLHEPKASS
jgi:hypothetical protein